MSSKTILFCGGGSLGHVVPSIAVMQSFSSDKEVRSIFVCADRTEERAMLTENHCEFRVISAPKFPRGLSFALLVFPCVFLRACMASLTIIRTEKPDVIFSKGGFVSVPVCLAGAFYGAPIVIHESDSVLSLSNSLLARFAKKVCTGFVLKNPPEWLAKKLVHTGNPVRASVTLGSKDAAKRLTGFSGRRPVLLVIGGSQGALSLNKAIDEQFEHLIDRVDIIHLTGIGKSVPRIHARYYARPYVLGELPHLYALADIVVTRAGAGALSEIAAVKKPAIVIPLEGVAHDHQVRNAENLAALGAVELLRQTDIAMLGARIVGLLEEPERAASLSSSLHNAFPSDAAAKIRAIILDAVGI